MDEYVVPLIIVGILSLISPLNPFLIIGWLAWLGYKYFSQRDQLNIIRVFIGLLTLYITTGYLVYYFGGITYFGVRGETIEYITKYSFLSVLFIHVICIFLSRKYNLPSLNEIRFKLLGKARRVKRDRIVLAYLLLFLAGTLMWYDVIFTIGSLSPVGNRELVGELLFGNNHYFQLIFISVTIFVMFILKVRKKRWINYWGACLLFWLWYPTIVVGARKEIFIIGVVFYMFSNFKTYQKIGVVALFLTYMFGIPIVREGWSGVALNILSIQEFILPQYVHHLLYESSQTSIEYVRSFSSYKDGFWVFLPGFLRLSEFQPLGVSFFDLGKTNVALGANPIGEAWLNFGDFGYIFFIFSFVLLVYFLLIRNHKNPEFFVIAVPYLALYGRSDLWVTLFFIIYSGLLLKLLFTGIKVESEDFKYKI